MLFGNSLEPVVLGNIVTDYNHQRNPPDGDDKQLIITGACEPIFLLATFFHRS